jgi:hypothetical protein
MTCPGWIVPVSTPAVVPRVKMMAPGTGVGETAGRGVWVEGIGVGVASGTIDVGLGRMEVGRMGVGLGRMGVGLGMMEVGLGGMGVGMEAMDIGNEQPAKTVPNMTSEMNIDKSLI